MTANQTTRTQKQSRKNLALNATVIILLVSFSCLTIGYLAKNPATSAQPWMVKGAYADYEGQTTIQAATVSLGMKIEISDLNSTHLQILTFINMTTPNAKTQNTTTLWVEKSSNIFLPENQGYSRTYTTQVSVPQLGTRSCTAYEYQNGEVNTTYYVDNQLCWPDKLTIRLSLGDEQLYTMDLNLAQTNIPGL